MYAPSYGFPNATPPTFNHAPPQNQNPHVQPGSAPGQPGQPMMYNPQQFGGMGAQGPFVSGPNAAMMAGGGSGPMQNAAMQQHMAGNGQIGYQTPYTSPPYGASVPSGASPQQFPPNYMVGGGMPGFQMNAAAMPPQQPMMQRVPQQPNAAAMSTPQRPMNTAQGTPNSSMMSQQPQFSTPQAPSQAQPPTNPQQPATTVTTPQTPTFPSTSQGTVANGAPSASTPLSPGTKSKEQERFALLLAINGELLFETIQLQNSVQELKAEQASSMFGQNEEQERKVREEEQLTMQDKTQCMRRLQANLAYLAALADRKTVQTPSAPAYLMPPSLNLSLKLRASKSAPDGEVKKDLTTDREERDRTLKDMYTRLQAMFPGVDPKREPTNQGPAKSQAPGARPPPGTQANPLVGQGQPTPKMANTSMPMSA